MAIDRLDENLNIISALDDEPNDAGGLSAAELKSKFDEGANTIKNYINGLLIPELDAEHLPLRYFAEGGQSIKEALDGVVLGTIPDGTITAQKLAEELKTLIEKADSRKLLSHLLTTPGTSEFIVPEGMKRADIVILGGGASGEYYGGSAQGGGGGSGYITFVEGRKMTPGEIIPAVVGADAAPVSLTSGYNMPGNLSAFDGYMADGGKGSCGEAADRWIGSAGGSGGAGRSKDETMPGGSNGTSGTTSPGSAYNRPAGQGSGARARNPHDPSGNYCGGGASSGGATRYAEASVRGGLGFMGRGGDSGRNATGYGNGGGGHYANPPGKGTQGCILIYTSDDLKIERPLADFYYQSNVESMPGILKAKSGTGFADIGAWSEFLLKTIEGTLSFSCTVSSLAADCAFGLSSDPSAYGSESIGFGFVSDKAQGRMYVVNDGTTSAVFSSLAEGDTFKIAFEGGKFVWYKNGSEMHAGTAFALIEPLIMVMGFGGTGGEIRDIKWRGRAIL